MGYTDDFDAWLAEAEPLYTFNLGGYAFVIPEVNVEGFARFATLDEQFAGLAPLDMLGALRGLVREQLRPEDRDRWDSTEVPWRVLQRIAERVTEAAVGRPTGGLSGWGDRSSPTGQSLKGDSSAPDTLPPPSAP